MNLVTTPNPFKCSNTSVKNIGCNGEAIYSDHINLYCEECYNKYSAYRKTSGIYIDSIISDRLGGGRLLRSLTGYTMYLPMALKNFYTYSLKTLRPLKYNLDLYNKLPSELKELSIPSRALYHSLFFESGVSFLEETIYEDIEFGIVYTLIKRERSEQLEKNIVNLFKTFNLEYNLLYTKEMELLFRYIYILYRTTSIKKSVFKEGEKILKLFPLGILFLSELKQSRIKRCENIIFSNFECLSRYMEINNIYEFPEFENYINNRFTNMEPKEEYINTNLKKLELETGTKNLLPKRFSELIQNRELLSSLIWNTDFLTGYCLHKRRRRWEDIEPYIFLSSKNGSIEYMLEFAQDKKDFLEDRVLQDDNEIINFMDKVIDFVRLGGFYDLTGFENKISTILEDSSGSYTSNGFIHITNKLISYKKVSDVNLTENSLNFIGKNGSLALRYAEVIKGRFPKGEMAIIKDPISKTSYEALLKKSRQEQ